MARKIKSRLKISGTFVAETPLHVGGLGENVDTDLPLAQNGKGEWYVPGTSIAGALRGWCSTHFDKNLIEEIFGPQQTDEGHASFVLVEDATIEQADKVLTEIRDGVGIDRYYGVAADKAKFDRAILPRGTKLNFVMTVEVGERHDANKTKAVIGNLLAALAASRVRLGAARTRGLGRVKLIGQKREDGKYEAEPEIKEQPLIGVENILKLLRDEGETRSVAALKEAATLATNSPPRLELAITWRPRLPVMVKAGYDGIGVDMLPLTSGVDHDKLALCLPGSSIKGALRSHAERIVRTILACNTDQYPTRGNEFHEQIEGLPLIEDVFGAKNKQDNTKGLGALVIDDCYAKESYAMKAADWRAVEVASVQNEESYTRWELTDKLRQISNVDFSINHHVAIDRWTGGAAEGALYSLLAPSKVEWEEMRLTLDFDRLKGVELPALMMLLTLRDVAENRVPFGFATNRGLGEIAVERIEIVGQDLTDEWKALGEFVPTKSATGEEHKFQTGGGFAELGQSLKDRLSKEWSEWRSQQQS